MSQINDPTLTLLERSLTISLHRQNLLNANIANLDTPNYTPSDLDFPEVLSRMQGGKAGQIRQTDGRHFSEGVEEALEAATRERADVAPGLDGNSVDLDTQMARMAHNGIFYQAGTQAISRKLAVLKYVINDTGGV